MVCISSETTTVLESVVVHIITFACPCLSIIVWIVLSIIRVHIAHVPLKPFLRNGLIVLVVLE